MFLFRSFHLGRGGFTEGEGGEMENKNTEAISIQRSTAVERDKPP